MRKCIVRAVGAALGLALLFFSPAVSPGHAADGEAAVNDLQQQFIMKVYNAQSPDELKSLYLKTPSAQEKALIINQAGNMVQWAPEGVKKEELVDWLDTIYKSEKDGSLRQASLYGLYLAGDKEALSRLVLDVEKNGLSPRADFGGFTYDWHLLKEIIGKYPQSYIARGITAYEKVRGESYFAIERSRNENEPYSWLESIEYGDAQYHPAGEITGWEEFIKDFSGHPAADDAAYRLARCYEINGQWTGALNTLQRAITLPDGDMRYHAAGRLVYIQDVRMTAGQLKEIPEEKLDPAVKPMVEYTLAVKALRMGDYKQAASLLEGFINKTGADPAAGNISPFSSLDVEWGQKYDFTGSVRKQLEQSQKLAELNTVWENSGNPEDLYNLAAAIFHDQLTYYNHLWAGNRQWFYSMGYISNSGAQGPPAEMAPFVREMVNYQHSAGLFGQVYENTGSSPDLKAKALYSQGLSYLGLYDWGQDISAAFDRKTLRKQVVDTFEKFLGEYPGSSMADDALLALAGISGDKTYLDRLFKDYPGGDAIDKARLLLEEMNSPYYSKPE